MFGAGVEVQKTAGDYCRVKYLQGDNTGKVGLLAWMHYQAM